MSVHLATEIRIASRFERVPLVYYSQGWSARLSGRRLDANPFMRSYALSSRGSTIEEHSERLMRAWSSGYKDAGDWQKEFGPAAGAAVPVRKDKKAGSPSGTGQYQPFEAFTSRTDEQRT
jgi:hypothetical protein